MERPVLLTRLVDILQRKQAASVDDIGYQGKLDYQEYVDQPTPLLGDNWKTYDMPPPPANSSEETLAELHEINCLEQSATEDIKAKTHRQDTNDPEMEFVQLFEATGTQLTDDVRELISTAAGELTTICMHFKLLFNRPRPSQLFEVFGIKHNPFITTTGNSPAYPSGHALTGRFIALMLSDLYPFYKKQLMQLGYELGALRVVGGMHFASDFTAGVDLADYLYDNCFCGNQPETADTVTVTIQEHVIDG
jgi:hypothetical protein